MLNHLTGVRKGKAIIPVAGRNRDGGGRRTYVLGRLLPFGMALLLSACAASRPFVHSLTYCNRDAKPISDVRIQYGEITWPPHEIKELEKGNTECRPGTGITAEMPVPRMMTVSWKTQDGAEHRKKIPIRSLLNGEYPTHELFISFFHDEIYISERTYPLEGQHIDFPANPVAPFFRH